MGKQNSPLILDSVNKAARNAFNPSQKQIKNKNAQQQKAVKQQKESGWTVVTNRRKSSATKDFKKWADRTKGEPELKKIRESSIKSTGIQKSKAKQQVKAKPETQPIIEDVDTITWRWYPQSKHEEEIRKLKERNSLLRSRRPSKPKPRQQSKKQRMRTIAMIKNKAKREAEAARIAKEQRIAYGLLKNINTVYDGFNHIFALQTNRNAWIASTKVGGNKVLSVATLYAIRNEPFVRTKRRSIVQKRGKIIFNNKYIRHAVEGRFTGHNKIRGNRILTNIPKQWLIQENGYAKGANYDKFAVINGPKRNERCYSFKGVY